MNRTTLWYHWDLNQEQSFFWSAITCGSYTVKLVLFGLAVVNRFQVICIYIVIFFISNTCQPQLWTSVTDVLLTVRDASEKYLWNTATGEVPALVRAAAGGWFHFSSLSLKVFYCTFVFWIHVGQSSLNFTWSTAFLFVAEVDCWVLGVLLVWVCDMVPVRRTAFILPRDSLVWVRQLNSRRDVACHLARGMEIWSPTIALCFFFFTCAIKGPVDARNT